jgi:uncharacterized protein YbjT (DUF2867 family)
MARGALPERKGAAELAGLRVRPHRGSTASRNSIVPMLYGVTSRCMLARRSGSMHPQTTLTRTQKERARPYRRASSCGRDAPQVLTRY